MRALVDGCGPHVTPHPERWCSKAQGGVWSFAVIARHRLCPHLSVSSIRKQENSMATLKGSKTEQSLKEAFSIESQANRRYMYFANKADMEGQNDVAALFRSTAEGETGHAHGHMEFMEQAGDPVT